MTDNQPGDEMPDGMPAWPSNDEAPVTDLNGFVQQLMNALYPLDDGRSQVVSGFILVVETMASDGTRGMHTIPGPSTPPWTAIGLMSVAKTEIEMAIGEECDCEDGDHE
jgi:hypothetical protein